MIHAARPPKPGRGYEHMGAVLVDAGLQAGVSYAHVVEPRVQRVLFYWPTATTVSRFRAKYARFGLRDLLRWDDSVKLKRIEALAELFCAERVDSVADARGWLTSAAAELLLLELVGVGPKTVSYLRILVDLPDIAVDRHVRAFARRAGVTGPDGLIHRHLVAAADECRLSLAEADRLIFAAATGVTSKTGASTLERLRRALAKKPLPITSATCRPQST